MSWQVCTVSLTVALWQHAGTAASASNVESSLTQLVQELTIQAQVPGLNTACSSKLLSFGSSADVIVHYTHHTSLAMHQGAAFLDALSSRLC